MEYRGLISSQSADFNWGQAESLRTLTLNLDLLQEGWSLIDYPRIFFTTLFARRRVFLRVFLYARSTAPGNPLLLKW